MKLLTSEAEQAALLMRGARLIFAIAIKAVVGCSLRIAWREAKAYLDGDYDEDDDDE